MKIIIVKNKGYVSNQKIKRRRKTCPWIPVTHRTYFLQELFSNHAFAAENSLDQKRQILMFCLSQGQEGVPHINPSNRDALQSTFSHIPHAFPHILVCIKIATALLEDNFTICVNSIKLPKSFNPEIPLWGMQPKKNHQKYKTAVCANMLIVSLVQ